MWSDLKLTKLQRSQFDERTTLMSTASEKPGISQKAKPHKPFRRAVLRGLAIVMPPLLTIGFFAWGWSLIDNYVLSPIETGLAFAASSYEFDKQVTVPADVPRSDITEDGSGVITFVYKNRTYKRGSDGHWVGYYDTAYYKEHRLDRTTVLLLFIPLFVLTLYLLGKSVAVGIGRMLVNQFEKLIQRVPLVSNVYSAVKQVTDFVFTESEIEFNRVVAVQYPRLGIWSVGFVTGESMADIQSSANEPVLSVLMPTSPMPVTGFTITVLKSEAIDLNITIDQAIQFIVSCGVVVPRQQQHTHDADQIATSVSAAIAQHTGGNGDSGNGKRAEERTDIVESSD
jgi:uncharacterized membrane protein